MGGGWGCFQQSLGRGLGSTPIFQSTAVVPSSQPACHHARPEAGPGPIRGSWHAEIGLQQVQAQGGCPEPGGRADCSKHGRASLGPPAGQEALSSGSTPARTSQGVGAAFLPTCSGSGLSAPPGCRDQLTPVAQGGVSNTARPRGRLPLTCPCLPSCPGLGLHLPGGRLAAVPTDVLPAMRPERGRVRTGGSRSPREAVGRGRGCEPAGTTELPVRFISNSLPLGGSGAAGEPSVWVAVGHTSGSQAGCWAGCGRVACGVCLASTAPWSCVGL